MPNSMCSIRSVFVAISLSLVTGCASITHVQDVTSDKEGFLIKKFSPQMLLPTVSKKLPTDEITGSFQRLSITTEANAVYADGRKVTYNVVHNLINVGNGLVQQMQESSSNNIPFQLLYALTYRGIIPLRWQTINIGDPKSISTTSEIKDVVRIDPIPMSLDKEFVTDIISGADIQLINFSSEQATCRTTNAIAASDIHKKLSGQAIEIECTYREKNTVRHNGKWVMLKDYGVAIMIENTTTAQKTTIRVTDIVI